MLRPPNGRLTQTPFRGGQYVLLPVSLGVMRSSPWCVGTGQSALTSKVVETGDAGVEKGAYPSSSERGERGVNELRRELL